MKRSWRLDIDGRLLKSKAEFHILVKASLEFPDYYGMNADAFWDCLTEMLYAKDSIDVVWKSYSSSLSSMGHEAEILRRTLMEAQSDFPGLLTVVIEI